MPNLVGQQFSTYHLTRLRERTAFTEVYTAAEDESGTRVDFKVLQPELSSEERELFLDAAKTLLTITHPHIARVLEVGQATYEGENFPFLVVEHSSNQTLRLLHSIGSSLAPETILTYVKPIAEALHYAHQQNLVHGDVKPGNIFVDEQQRIVLSDFSTGLLSRLTDTVIGTVAYVAPEQLQEQALPASDQYALAVIVYEWLTGELPFSGSVSQISSQHLQTPPPPLRSRIPELPQSLEDVVLTALAKDPEQRFPDILDFANSLETALAEVPAELFSQEDTPQEDEQSDPPPTGSLLAEPSSDWEDESLLPEPPTVSEPLPTIPGTMLDPEFDEEKPLSRSLASVVTRRSFLIGLPALVIVASGFASWYFHQEPTTTPGTAHSATLLIYRGHAGPVTALDWSPDGSYLASGGNDHTIQIWQASSGKIAYTFRGKSGGVPSLSWASDSQRIVTASAGPTTSGGSPAQGNTVQIWQALTGKALYTYTHHTRGITDVAWNPAGNRIASASTDYTVQIWDAATGQHPLIHPTSPWYAWSLAWSPDGQSIASGGPDTNIQTWKATDGKVITTYQGHSASIEAVVWSPDGLYLASGSDDHTIRVWPVASTTSSLTYRGHTDYVRGISWSPDGKYIASGSSDKTVQVWYATTGARLYTYRGHSASVTSVVWAPDGKYVASGSEDGTVQIWQPF